MDEGGNASRKRQRCDDKNEGRGDDETDADGLRVIHVRALTSHIIYITTHEYADVSSLKQMVEFSGGTPSHSQCLIFNGRQLKNGTELSFYGLASEGPNIVELVLPSFRCTKHEPL